MTSQSGIYYLPISDPDVLLDGKTLLKNLLQRIVEKHINGFSNYTNEPIVVRINIIKIEIEFNEYLGIFVFYYISDYTSNSCSPYCIVSRWLRKLVILLFRCV